MPWQHSTGQQGCFTIGTLRKQFTKYTPLLSLSFSFLILNIIWYLDDISFLTIIHPECYKNEAHKMHCGIFNDIGRR